MRYYKNLENGYILAVGTGIGNMEITAEEYAHLIGVIAARPTPSEGKDYRLTESLAWEEYDKPVEAVDEIATETDYQSALAEMGVAL